MRKVLAVTAAVLTMAASGLVSTGVAAAAAATPITANFSGDTEGAKPNGFSSAGAPQMFFYDTAATGLAVGDYGNQSHGNGLAHFLAGALEIRFSAPTTAISLAFGNDDPALSNTSDMARLTLFRGTTQVGLVDTNFNANDIMDQTVGTSSGPLFNRVTLLYVDAAGTAKNLTEVADDITINPPCTIVGTAGNDHLKGTSGNDVICGDSGKDVISGRGGDDLVYGGSGKDTIKGGKGKDTLNGGKGKDHLVGGKGKDTLAGGKGKDTLSGGKGKDKLAGGTGKDNCDGGKGHDSAASCEFHVNIP
jgi:RTX calcium-binding nonapeptide repeat (4 copies)